MNTPAKLALVAFGALLLVGCGGGLRVIKPEVDDVVALRSASAFHVKPVTYDFEVPADWEIPAKDWPVKTGEWNKAYSDWASHTERKPVYALGPGSEASEGAVIETSVTSMKLRIYTFFVNALARIWGKVTITDVKSGKVIFKGAFEAPGGSSGHDFLSYEGRVKTAHKPVAEDLAWLINREKE